VEKLSGVTAVIVDLAAKSVVIKGEDFNESEIKDKISEIGYEVVD